MHSLQDFAKYKKMVLKKPAAIQWVPDIPSLLLGALLGLVFSSAALSKMSTIKIPNALETSILVAEQPKEKLLSHEVSSAEHNNDLPK
jgi:hypothetical protein